MINDTDFNNLTHQLHLAYYDARKHKRNTQNQLEFELDYDVKLIELAEQIYHRTYQPKPSVVFMVNKPVKREIFTATDNYQKQAFILKLDIQGYFMHIKHEVIYQKVLKILDKNKTYNGLSFELIDYLMK
jgi:hypothetical protein